MSLPQMTLGTLRISRLMVGGNPFSGHAHQTPELSREMLDYYSTARIHQVLRTCESTGIDTLVARADAHIMRMLRDYRNDGGGMQWIAQTAPEMLSLERNIQQAADNGAAAIYLHGGWVERQWCTGHKTDVAAGLQAIRNTGRPAGIASHFPTVHREIAAELAPDFHLVCCFQCGSIHNQQGERFDLDDVAAALEVTGQLARPCIVYKVLGAGRYDPAVMLPRVYSSIKPADAVLIGFWPKHQPRQVEETAALVRRLIGHEANV